MQTEMVATYFPKGATGATGAKGADGKSSFQNYASNTNWELGTNRSTYSANYSDAFTINGTSSENRVEWDIGLLVVEQKFGKHETMMLLLMLMVVGTK